MKIISESWGKVNILVERTANNFRFPGQYYIEETGLYYNWWRWYKSDTGRYIQVDRIMETNREYVYSGSNTINRYDLFGLYDCPSGWHDCETLREDLRRTADEYCNEDIVVPYQEGCYCKFCYCVCYKNAERGDPNRKIKTKCKCVEYKSKNCRIA